MERSRQAYLREETLCVTERRRKLLRFFAIMGPGIVVMLADTDVGSIITAAQSGAVWGYKLLPIQFILIPILYVIQELTVRLGAITGKGHGELIKERFGKPWAWIATSTLIVASTGALITEMAGIGMIGTLVGIPEVLTVWGIVIVLSIIVLTGSYRSVERIAIIFGSAELIFIIIAIWAHPNIGSIANEFTKIPFGNQNYLYLTAANIGAVIMPWMIFYQQSAVVDKGLKSKDIKMSRWDTLIGAIVTQIIMSAVLVVTAATVGRTNPGQPLQNVQQIIMTLTPFIGHGAGELLLSAGIIGAGLVAAIVVSLAVAWGLGEVTGYSHSLADNPKKAPFFYITYISMLAFAGILLSIPNINLIGLSVSVQVMNALLLPIVLGFLYILALKALPKSYRLKGKKAFFVGSVVTLTCLFSVVAILI